MSEKPVEVIVRPTAFIIGTIFRTLYPFSFARYSSRHWCVL